MQGLRPEAHFERSVIKKRGFKAEARLSRAEGIADSPEGRRKEKRRQGCFWKGCQGRGGADLRWFPGKQERVRRAHLSPSSWALRGLWGAVLGVRKNRLQLTLAFYLLAISLLPCRCEVCSLQDSLRIEAG